MHTLVHAYKQPVHFHQQYNHRLGYGVALLALALAAAGLILHSLLMLFSGVVAALVMAVIDRLAQGRSTGTEFATPKVSKSTPRDGGVAPDKSVLKRRNG